jgi:C-terminal processing protease CtpA/Prc
MARDGVVFDIRNNNGGFVNAYALDVLTRRHYLAMTFRGWPRGSARSLLGQRALERPTVLVTNQHSLSDAEDFSEGYRALGLGRIVGEPTAGWIIYTTNQEMLDGSTVRLPFITITTAGGEPMEMHPRPVDIPVTRGLGEDAQGKDSQLEAAVQALLQQLDADQAEAAGN